jgi:hypothetical protein
MARWTNSIEAKRQWSERAPFAPYRASVGKDLVWKTDQPHWVLAAALKASRRGHRLLMAFEQAEVRDYFLAGHRDQDAQVEPNGAEEASPRKSTVSRPVHRTLEEAKAAVITSRRAENDGLNEVERVFNDEVDRLLTEGKPEEALRIIRSMHADCVMKTIAFDTVRKSGLWNLDTQPSWKLEPMPFTQERAAAMLAWLRAHLTNRETEDALGAIAYPMAQLILDREGHTAVAAFNDAMPPSLIKALIGDMARYGKPRPVSSETPIKDGP